tara:strand:+ start:395 stop:838 length:444 start_codon:yes stop_codon:yes gene_type:complete
MPKPVLSDSLFNADDVATAVLAEANLQIANSNLGVTNITNKFNYASGITNWFSSPIAYYFNGFVFLNFAVKKDSGTITDTSDVLIINDPDYYPNQNQPLGGYYGPNVQDGGDIFEVRTTGGIRIVNTYNQSATVHYTLINGFYHTSV